MARTFRTEDPPPDDSRDPGLLLTCIRRFVPRPGAPASRAGVADTEAPCKYPWHAGDPPPGHAAEDMMREQHR
jgi:hypothetical protein